MDRIEEIDIKLEQEKKQLKSKLVSDKYAEYNFYLGKFVRKTSKDDNWVFKPTDILFNEKCFECVTVSEIGLRANWIYFESKGECKFEILTEQEIKQLKMETINNAIKDLNEFFNNNL